ncbi:4369_t:CDS:1 [Cetraspora pellucida]|uniref:4369_t:CDS:1 n=1 Tax=Cetraspora pellucida TaxID=1433469 RepID=A0A9N9CUE5_9GLOM|nr:4369_t:CDS:1 [Cetraspora pellucida]
MKRITLCILIAIIAVLATFASADTFNDELSLQDIAPEKYGLNPTPEDSPYQPTYQESDVEEVPSGEDSESDDIETSQMVKHRKFRECIWKCRYTASIWTNFWPLKQCVVKCITIVNPRIRFGMRGLRSFGGQRELRN